MKDKWNNPPNKTDNAELSTRQKKLKTFSPPKTCAFHRSGNGVKGQHAGCEASGQPLTE